MHLAHGVSVGTPLNPTIKLDITAGDNKADTHQYQSIVGTLMYATLATRPDIAFAVAALSRYNSAPFTTHSLSKASPLLSLQNHSLRLHFSAVSTASESITSGTGLP